MKSILTLSLSPFAIVYALTGFAVSAAQPELHLEEQVDGYVEPYLDTGNFSGTILIGRGDEIFSKGYGFANVEKKTLNGPGTSFYLASTSRIFTSAAILLLEQRGKLSVDDLLARHLPDWPRGDEITIHHLLTLSAGLPNINELPGYGFWSRSPQTPASLCQKFRDLPLEFEPGTRSVHSNSNYNLLALLIEKLSGQTYGEFLEQEFFEPLGMTHTAHDSESDRTVEHRALGYTPVGLAELRPAPTLNWSVKTGNGSIYSTVEDLYRFDRMLVAKSILNDESVAKLFTEYFLSNGYGWFVEQSSGAKVVSIGGRSPGFGSSWQRSVEADVTVIVLGNIYNGVPSTIASELRATMLGEAVQPSPMRADPPDPEVLSDVVGAYQFGPDFYRANATVRFRDQGGHLFNGGSWLIPAGEMTFIHRTYWSTLTFLRDESGTVDRLRYDDFVGARVK